MARREWERACEECRQPIVNNGTSTLHKLCVGPHQRRKFDEQRNAVRDFEPQRITEAPGPLGRPLDDPRNNPRHNEARREGGFLSPVRIGVIDIETTGLNAGFGVILCAVVKAYSPDERKIFRADEYEPWQRGKRSDDSQLLRALLSYIEDVDVLVAHNGLKFDLPFIRTRAVIHGLPPVNFQKIIDPVQLSRQHFRFSGNSLQSISQIIGTQVQKTPLTPAIWQRASLDGDAAALQEIVDHCVADVDVLEEVCWKLRGYVKQIDRAGSFR
jgi:DNA polymerase III epsilon subunit-like protein